MKSVLRKINSYYCGDFSNWGDVQYQFRTNIEEPDFVWAKYEYEQYEGSATVIYSVEDKFYLVSGSHCSCYGLEGQFDPTEYNNKDELLNALHKGFFWWKDEAISVLKTI